MKFNLAMTSGEVMTEIGQRIAAIRLSRNLTQEDMAKKSGISLATVKRLESGASNIGLSPFLAVCVELALTVGFESLLPTVRSTPQDIFSGKQQRRRARHRKVKKEFKWGNEE